MPVRAGRTQQVQLISISDSGPLWTGHVDGLNCWFERLDLVIVFNGLGFHWFWVIG